MSHNLYLISGLSGCGKTTLGKYVAEKKSAVFVDQDSFYYQKKPIVRLSDGTNVKNWDCVEVMDWVSMKLKVISLLRDTDVVLVGFALRHYDISTIKDYAAKTVHIELSYGDEEELNLQRCIDSRKKSKTINEERDVLVVKELVWPFYCETKKDLRSDKTIYVYKENGERKGLKNLYTECFEN